MKWAKEEARIETLKYKREQQAEAVQITFHLTKSWIMISRSFTVAAIFSRRPFTIVSSLIKHVGNSGINIDSSMISTLSFPI